MQGYKVLFPIAVVLLLIVIAWLFLHDSSQDGINNLSSRFDILDMDIADIKRDIQGLDDRLSDLEARPQVQEEDFLKVYLEPEIPIPVVSIEQESKNAEQTETNKEVSGLCEVNGFVRYNNMPISKVQVEYWGPKGETFLTDSSGFYRGTLNKGNYIVKLNRFKVGDDNKDIIFRYNNYKNVKLINDCELLDYDIVGYDIPIKLRYGVDDFDQHDRVMLNCNAWSNDPSGMNLLFTCYTPIVTPNQKEIVLHCLIDNDTYFLMGSLWGNNARYKHDKINFSLKNGIPDKQLTLTITKEFNLLIKLSSLNDISLDKLQFSLRFHSKNGTHTIGNIYWKPENNLSYKLHSDKTGEGELRVKCFTDDQYSFSKHIVIPESKYVTVSQHW